MRESTAPPRGEGAAGEALEPARSRLSWRTPLHLYWWWLRAHPFQELLACVGIAVGVALLFAVQVANTSMTGSAAETERAITGTAQIELAARDDLGFDARLVQAVRMVPGVLVAAPELDRRALVVGPRGSRSVSLVGADPTLAALGGSVAHDFGPNGLQLPPGGIVTPDGIAHEIGVGAGQPVRLLVAGRAYRLSLAAPLSRGQIGSLVGSQVAIGRLADVQRFTRMTGRLSRIFIKTAPGDERRVRAALVQLVAGRLDVGPADAVVRRLRVAARPNDQSSLLFSAIAAMVGVLFAFNAMLLTMPRRRLFVSELRIQGFTPGQVVVVVGSQVLALGAVSAAAGLALGDLLSRLVFDSLPTYLAFTFPIGAQRIVSGTTIVLAAGAGILAAVLAAGRPLLDLLATATPDAVYAEPGDPGQALSGPVRRRLLLAGVALAAAAAVVSSAFAHLTIVAVLALAAAALLVVPAALTATVRVTERLARRARLNMLLMAAMEARSATTRSVAVAAIMALAVFGNVAIGGARDDLVRGLDAGYADHLSTADIWVTTAGQSLTTDDFPVSPEALRRLRSTPGIASARLYQGGMTDAGDKRTWIIARPPGDREMLPSSQLVSGDLAQAQERLRSGGWAAVSRTIASEQHLHVGSSFRQLTPTGPLDLRVAAIVTNLSWGPGAVIINTDDYRRAWRTDQTSAIEVNLGPGVTTDAGKRLVAAALGDTAALDVQSRRELFGEFSGLMHQGLARLRQISDLTIVAAALALAAALGAAVWQRRPRLAANKMESFSEWQLWRILLLETTTVLLLGAAIGMAAGLFGHLLGNRWLSLTTGFPAPFSPDLGQTLRTLALILGGAGAVFGLVGIFAVRVSPRESFQE